MAGKPPKLDFSDIDSINLLEDEEKNQEILDEVVRFYESTSPPPSYIEVRSHLLSQIGPEAFAKIKTRVQEKLRELAGDELPLPDMQEVASKSKETLKTVVEYESKKSVFNALITLGNQAKNIITMLNKLDPNSVFNKDIKDQLRLQYSYSIKLETACAEPMKYSSIFRSNPPEHNDAIKACKEFLRYLKKYQTLIFDMRMKEGEKLVESFKTMSAPFIKFANENPLSEAEKKLVTSELAMATNEVDLERRIAALKKGGKRTRKRKYKKSKKTKKSKKGKTRRKIRN